MVHDTHKDTDLLFELSSIETSLVDDDIFDNFDCDTEGELYPSGEEVFGLQTFRDAPGLEYVTLLVYCDIQDKRIKSLVQSYMRSLSKMHSSRDSTLGFNWRFAGPRERPNNEYTIPLYFYSAGFVNATQYVESFYYNSENSVFIVIDPTISSCSENFSETAKKAYKEEKNTTILLNINRIATILKSMDAARRLKFDTCSKKPDNTSKLLHVVESLLPFQQTITNSIDDLLIDYPAKIEYEPIKPEDDMFFPLRDNIFAESSLRFKDPLCAQANEKVCNSEPKRKRLKTQICANNTAIPKRQFRQKGQIYVVNNVRKKWDGRQWRRLCKFEGCEHAARGSITYCVSHYKQTRPDCADLTNRKQKDNSTVEKQNVEESMIAADTLEVPALCKARVPIRSY